MARVSFVVIAFVFALIFFAGSILLQIFLSKKESKWPGLLLPAITVLFSVLAILGIAIYSVGSGYATTQFMVDGVVVEETIIWAHDYTMSELANIINIFILMNIPTAVLLIIYAACRGKRRRQRDLEKMAAQDLE
ncbi:MAG: hypothetical protein FWC66_04295 [Oscillospiraceae bacterium]|nr:hypothetical protein [Oscillospiraceae bacterium]